MPDVRIAVVPFTSPTSAGTIDVVDTSGKLNGLVPTCVMIFGGDANGDGTVRNNATWLEGFAVNGGNTRSVSGWSEDNQTSTDCNAFWVNAAIIRPTQGVNNAAVSAWISDGITLNFSAADATARRYFAVLFAGGDVSAYVGQLDMTSSWTTAVDITAPGFAPELVFVAQCHDSSVNANTLVTTHFHMGWGVAHPQGSPQTTKYRAVSIAEGDLQAAAAPGVRASNDCVALSLGVGWELELTDFDASGFSARTTSSVGAGTIRVQYLALNLAGLPFYIGDANAPVTTGTEAYTGVGFTPQAVLWSGIIGTTINTGYSDANASGMAFGAFDATNQCSHSGRIRDAADPTDTDQIAYEAAMILPSSTDADATIADFVSMDADGFTLDFTTVSGGGELFVFMAFGEGTPIVAATLRTSQVAVYALGEFKPPVRVSQVALIALGEQYPLLRVSQIAVLALGSLTPCLTTRCRLWKLTRLDGTVFAYTDHDRDLTVAGVTYKQCASLMSSATQTASEADAVGDTQLTGILSDDDITEADLFAGLFDGATIEIFETSWDQTADPMTPRRLAAGIVGPAKQGEARFTVDALSYGGLIAQKALLQTVTPHCRFALYDSRCGLNRADFLETGTVTAVPALNAFTQANFRRFVDSSRMESGDYFALGKLTWLTGPNAGLSSEVKSFASGQFLLWEPLPYAISVGDTYEVAPGCDFLKPTCVGKFNNFANFGGFPDLPGTDAMIRTPDAKQ